MSIDAFERTVAGAAFLTPDIYSVFDALPAAIYATDADGILTYYNKAAAEMTGREPRVGVDRWCVTHRLYRTDGSFLPHDQCPMAVALREKRPVRNVEIVAERPDGTRVPAMPFPTPVFDKAGTMVGAVNMLVDITELNRAKASADRRADEQRALYEFTDRLYRAGTLEEIYAASLDAISDGLGCDRASVLLFDQQGVMRFVAWQGLSDAYRDAVDGHSPWTLGARDPSPIVLTDILASNESEALKAVVAGEGIRGLAFVPITSDGRVIGKFMTYYNEPHDFSASELALAVTLARQLGFAIDRYQGEAARAAAEQDALRGVERLRLATQAGKVGLWDWDIKADRIDWTDSLFAIHAVDKASFSPTFADWIDRIHPDDRGRVQAAVEGTLERDEPYEVELRTMRPDGSHSWVYAHATVVKDGEDPVRMVGASVDITERKRAEAEREFLLAELSHRVKNTLATVLSIAHQSLGNEPEVATARRRFEARVHALAQTHTRLAEANWSTVMLRTLVEDELAPYRNGGNLSVDGPAIALSPKQAIILGMAFHELATNAAKYGALSVAEGSVAVTWRLREGDQSVAVEWVETGGPAATAPTRSGFGRILIERALKAELRGDVALEFAPTGLRCSVRFPLRRDE